MPFEREVSRRTILTGRKFDFEEVTLRARTGATIVRQCVRHPGAVVVLPILESGGERRVVMIENERFCVGRTLLELPAGTREPGEEPMATAAREVEEETGYRAATLRPLARFYTTPGLTDELMWAFAAWGLNDVGARPEEDESLSVRVVPAAEAVRLAESGGIEDGKSILVLLLAARRGMI